MMRKTTASEALLLFVVFMAGTSASTLLAWYYPDSPAYHYAGAITIALIGVVCFLMARKKNAG